MAVDSTLINSWARPRRKGTMQVDPHARPTKKTNAKGRNEKYFGFGLSAFVPAEMDGSNDVPNVAYPVRLTDASTANSNPGPTAVRAIDTVLHDISISRVLADRGYSQQSGEKIHYPLRQRGIEFVFDLKSTERGLKVIVDGALMIDGGCFCPGLPKDLYEPEKPDIDLKTKNESEYYSRMRQLATVTDERAKYHLRKVAGPDKDGYRRVGCPARAGKVRCPLVPKSMADNPDRPTVVPPPEATQLKVCQQATITLPPDATKHWQPLLWGTRKWQEAYNKRSVVEGFFGTLEDESGQGMRRGKFRVFGLFKSLLMVAALVAAANHRQTVNYEARQRQAKPSTRGGYRKVTLATLSNLPPPEA